MKNPGADRGERAETGGIAERFGQMVTKYVVRSGIRDVEPLDATQLAHKLGLSGESVSEVRKVMKGTAGRPNATTLAKYFKVLDVSEADQDYVLGIGLTQVVPFWELVKVSTNADLGELRPMKARKYAKGKYRRAWHCKMMISKKRMR